MRRISIVMAVAVVGAAVMLSVAGPALAVSVLVSPGTGLAAGATRVHPDSTLSLLGNTFNVYTGGSLPAEWTLIGSLTESFSNGNLSGILRSEAYYTATGLNTLFLYQIENTGTVSIKTGNMSGFSASWQIIDSGIWDPNGDLAFDQGDVLKLARPVNGTQLDFAFQATKTDGNTLEKLLAAGQTSQWFYMVTDAPGATVGIATVQDGGLSASPIDALIPIPEPLTMLGVFAGVCGLGGYLRRRQQRA